MYNVAVVGGGPVGLSAATRIKQEGFEVVVLEEHQEIGKPVQCAGLVSKSGCDELKLPVDSCIVNSIKGVKIFSPGGEQLAVKRRETVAYVIDRERFDKLLYRKAHGAGVDVKLDMKLIDVRGQSIFTKYGGRGGLLKAEFVLGADGAASRVRELMRVETPSDCFLPSFQMKAQGNWERDFVEMHLGGFAKGFFGWVIPESSEIARVGVATKAGNARKAFDDFVEKKKIEAEFFDESAGVIPVSKPLKDVVRENMLIAGDAALQTKATTGGGLIAGIEAAHLAAKAVASHYKYKSPIKNYEKILKGLNHELEIHWKIRGYLDSLSSEKMDLLFKKMNKAKIPEFLEKEGDMDKPSRFLGKALLKPSMWSLAPELLKWMRG